MTPPATTPFPALINWLAAALLCLVLGASWLLDGPTAHSDELAAAQTLEDAQHAEAARHAWLQRQQQVCGTNSGWVELPDGTARCTTKRGRPTGVLLAGAHP